MDLLFTDVRKTEGGWVLEKNNKEYGSGHNKFEMASRCLSQNVKQADEYMKLMVNLKLSAYK